MVSHSGNFAKFHFELQQRTIRYEGIASLIDLGGFGCFWGRGVAAIYSGIVLSFSIDFPREYGSDLGFSQPCMGKLTVNPKWAGGRVVGCFLGGGVAAAWYILVRYD